MGTQASVSYSTTHLPIRILLLILFVPAVMVGCRGPWFKKTDDFDALIVTEKAEPRTPRGLVSSRLRPQPGEHTRAAPRPSGSRKISDSDDDLAAGDDIPPESQELFRRQMEALKNMQATPSQDLLAAEETATFSMSDDEEPVDKDSVEPVDQMPLSKVAINAKPGDQALKGHVADSKPSNPLSKDGQRIAASQKNLPSRSQSDVEQPVSSTPSQANSDHTVAPVSATAPVEKVESAPEATDKIEIAQSDWRVLASEALAALQAEADSATALSPDQKLSLEAKKRMLSLIVDDLEAAMAPIDSLQPHEQEFFQHEFQALHAATDPKANPVLNRRWTLALQSHRKAQMNLAAVSNLEIQNATFCTEVDSFGILSKFPQYHFRKDQELLLYCELDNFVSTPVKDGFETQLQGSYEIVDSNGRRVADQLLPMDEHVCRNQRRDYFIAYRMYMPQEIKPGRYTLKLTIEDMKGHKFGQTNVDFQIVQ